MEKTSTVRIITIIRKSDQKRILEAATVEALEINFYDSYIELDFKKENINYNMSIKEPQDFKIIIE